MVHQSNTTKKSPTMLSAEQKRLLSLNDELDNISEHMFNKVGSCFNQLQMPITHTKKVLAQTKLKPTTTMSTPSKHVEAIFKIVERLLDNAVLQHLDKLTLSVFTAGNVSCFPYKSFSETFNLVLTSLVRELLQSSSGNCQNSSFDFQVMRDFQFSIYF
jgi:hypothetical protein